MDKKSRFPIDNTKRSFDINILNSLQISNFCYILGSLDTSFRVLGQTCNQLNGIQSCSRFVIQQTDNSTKIGLLEYLNFALVELC